MEARLLFVPISEGIAEAIASLSVPSSCCQPVWILACRLVAAGYISALWRTGREEWAPILRVAVHSPVVCGLQGWVCLQGASAVSLGKAGNHVRA